MSDEVVLGERRGVGGRGNQCETSCAGERYHETEWSGYIYGLF